MSAITVVGRRGHLDFGLFCVVHGRRRYGHGTRAFSSVVQRLIVHWTVIPVRRYSWRMKGFRLLLARLVMIMITIIRVVRPEIRRQEYPLTARLTFNLKRAAVVGSITVNYLINIKSYFKRQKEHKQMFHKPCVRFDRSEIRLRSIPTSNLTNE